MSYHVGPGSYRLFKNNRALSKRDQVLSFVRTTLPTIRAQNLKVEVDWRVSGYRVKGNLRVSNRRLHSQVKYVDCITLNVIMRLAQRRYMAAALGTLAIRSSSDTLIS